METKICELDQLAIIVKDIEVSLPFYRDILGHAFSVLVCSCFRYFLHFTVGYQQACKSKAWRKLR